MLLGRAVAALAVLSSAMAADAPAEKTSKVKPIERIELDARAPMVRWGGDLESMSTGRSPPWMAVNCKVQGCGDTCPTTDNCRSAAPNTENELSVNFTGSAVTVYGNIWTDNSMSGLLGAEDLGDAVVSVRGVEEAPVKLANSGGKLLTLNLGENANQTALSIKFRPKGYLTVNTIELTLPTAALKGGE